MKSVVRTARKAHKCWNCSLQIEKGEQYVDHLGYPGEDYTNPDRPEHLRECGTCASRRSAPVGGVS